MERDAFLGRVRQAAAAGQAFRIGAGVSDRPVGYVGAAEDHCAALAAEIEAVGGRARIVASRVDAREVLTDLLRNYDARRVLLWRHALLDQIGVAELLGESEIAWDDHESLSSRPWAEQRRAVLDAQVGISSVDFAVAETGSLVVCSRPGQERLTSLAPPIHIAVVAASQIVPDLFDVFAALDRGEFEDFPSNIAFITGPSKTGDIELQLTTGVHGPGQWHVLIVRDAS